MLGHEATLVISICFVLSGAHPHPVCHFVPSQTLWERCRCDPFPGQGPVTRGATVQPRGRSESQASWLQGVRPARRRPAFGGTGASLFRSLPTEARLRFLELNGRLDWIISNVPRPLTAYDSVLTPSGARMIDGHRVAKKQDALLIKPGAVWLCLRGALHLHNPNWSSR